MVLLVVGLNWKYFVQTWRKKGLFVEKKIPICDWSRSDKMPEIDQITENASYTRSYFWVDAVFTNGGAKHQGEGRQSTHSDELNKISRKSYSDELNKITHKSFYGELNKITHKSYSDELNKITHKSFSDELNKNTHKSFAT